MVSVSVGRLAAGCLIEEAQFCGADRRENEVTEPGSSGGHSQSCSAAAAAAGSGGGERRRRGAAGRGGGRGRGAAGRPSRRSAGDAQRGGGAAAAPRGGSRAAAPAPSEARRRISSKIKASPKSNRIAVTDFHGTVKRDRLKSPKRNEVSGMEVHLSQPPAPFAEAGNGFNRRLAKADGTTGGKPRPRRRQERCGLALPCGALCAPLPGAVRGAAPAGAAIHQRPSSAIWRGSSPSPSRRGRARGSLPPRSSAAPAGRW
ncbi:uncharacterized protein GJ701_005729 [Geothlypis trichas]